MINFVQYLNSHLPSGKYLKFEIEVIPALMQQELDARRKVGIWWLQSIDEDSVFKIVGRSVIDRYETSRNIAFMELDVSESYSCISSIGNSVKVKLPELVINSRNFHSINDATHSEISASVRNSTGCTLSKTKGYIRGRSCGNLHDSLRTTTRQLFSEVFLRSINEPYFKRNEDTRDFISGAGIHVLDSLIKRFGVDPFDAYDAVVICDPICRDIIQQLPTINQPTLETPPQRLINSNDLFTDTFAPYVNLNDEALKPRIYSDPTSFGGDMAATQRAENVHQLILQSIAHQLGTNYYNDIKYSELADMAIFEPRSEVPLHIIEIKSATPDNIDSQYSKGLIQLTRLRFLHRRNDIKLHLVAEHTSVQPPPYLVYLASQLDIIIHQFDLKSPGLNSCQSLYKYLYNSYEKSSN